MDGRRATNRQEEPANNHGRRKRKEKERGWGSREKKNDRNDQEASFRLSRREPGCLGPPRKISCGCSCRGSIRCDLLGRGAQARYEAVTQHTRRRAIPKRKKQAAQPSDHRQTQTQTQQRRTEYCIRNHTSKAAWLHTGSKQPFSTTSFVSPQRCSHRESFGFGLATTTASSTHPLRHLRRDSVSSGPGIWRGTSRPAARRSQAAKSGRKSSPPSGKRASRTTGAALSRLACDCDADSKLNFAACRDNVLPRPNQVVRHRSS